MEALGTLLPTEDNGVCLMTAVSYAPRATDERVTCLRIYADVDGETHMEDIDIALLPRAFFAGHPPLRDTGPAGARSRS